MPRPRKTALVAAGPTSPQISVSVSCPVHPSFRVSQVAGMFDVPLAEKSTETFDVELPALDECSPLYSPDPGSPSPVPWQIGLIVGPSGSGKSTIARHAYGQALYTGGDWPADRAVIDGFPESLSIRDLTALLTSVGFSSPPSWVKPYHVLSGGEKFRCDLARALCQEGASGREGEREKGRLVVFDEFTSVVDRTVAKVGSAAISKHIRRVNSSPPLPGSPSPALQFVAVTCHYDVAEWLAPDWILDMAGRSLARGRLQRPRIELSLYRGERAAWRLFARHHYLSGSLMAGARCYVGTIAEQPAAFVAVIPPFGKYKVARPFAGVRMISRVVVLPDFQGLGIAGKMLAAVAELLAAEGHQARITTGHPGMIGLLSRDPRWRITRCDSRQNARRGSAGRDSGRSLPTAAGRMTASARWQGAPAPSPLGRGPG